MFDKILELIISQGVWTLLSFVLIFYILKAQEKRDLKQDERESKYQEIISNLSSKFEVISLDLKEIKNKLENLID